MSFGGFKVTFDLAEGKYGFALLTEKDGVRFSLLSAGVQVQERLHTVCIYGKCILFS